MELKPKAFRNLNSCKVLEQDVGLITTQEDHFGRNPERALADDFLLLKSSDRFVGEYRKWMDRVGHGMPWFQGLTSRSLNVANHLTGSELPPSLDPSRHRASNQASVETRYHRHVMHCPTTRNMLLRVKLWKRIFAALSITALTTAIGLVPMAVNGSLRRVFVGLVTSVPLLTCATALMRKLEKCFYASFKRKDQLFAESGL